MKNEFYKLQVNTIYKVPAYLCIMHIFMYWTYHTWENGWLVVFDIYLPTYIAWIHIQNSKMDLNVVNSRTAWTTAAKVIKPVSIKSKFDVKALWLVFIFAAYADECYDIGI